MHSVPYISIVSPVYKGENLTGELVNRLHKVLKEIGKPYEIVLVEDGSTQASWDKIQKKANESEFVKGILLSRNCGQHIAIYAGLQASKGEWVVVMDCDLQDRPEEIPHFLSKAINENFHVVLGKRVERNDHFIKTLGSKIFYKVLAYLTNTKQDSTVANFGIYHRKVIDSIISMQDKFKYFPAMVNWVGFRQTKLEIQHDHRFAGTSSYSFRKLLKLGFNVILSFSDKPLKLVLQFGLMVSVFSIVMAFYFVFQYLTGEIKVLGWASLMVSIWFFSGFIIFFLGMIGLYLGKTFDHVKNRPVYIIQETINV